MVEQKKEAKPPPKVEPEPVPERVLSDEELFMQAVEGVDQDAAVLQKYANDDPARADVDEAEGSQKKDVRDESLFRQWVQDMDN